MLNQIKLTNFKCFKKETTFPLKTMNLFTGVNGSGKSTLLQSFLLMRQSIEYDSYTTRLILNGTCVNLGSFDDVRNFEISAREPILFEFYIDDSDSKAFEYIVRYELKPANDGMSLVISNLEIDMYNKDVTKVEKYVLSCGSDELYRLVKDSDPSHDLFRLVKLLPHYFKVENRTLSIPLIGDGIHDSHTKDNKNPFEMERIHFISADRIGPQESYKKAMLSQFPNVGTKGELTVNLLDTMAHELVNEKLCIGDNSRTLISQTEAWLGKLLYPLKLEIPRSKSNFLELFIGNAKPTNVGFGYCSILPVIVSGLIAKPGDKLIIENPEIHLHPKAQSELIQFLVAVANTGIQIFIESHSDHVLNGIRVAVKDRQIDKNEVAIFFHDIVESKNEKNISITSIELDKQGELSEYPTNFFDEYSNQLFKLV